MDIISIVKQLAAPRPNHSEALATTAQVIKDTLTSWGIPYTVQEFPLHPWIMVILAVTILLLAGLFLLAIYKKRPLAALLLALAIPAVLVLEMELGVPFMSWLSRKQGENIIVHFSPSMTLRELIFCAHYDSKTDFWDHLERARIYRLIPASIALSLFLVGLSFAARRWEKLGRGAPRAAVLVFAGLFTAHAVLLSLAFGGFVLLPREKESPGAVDNAGSVASLLALAKDIKEKRIDIGTTAVTIVFTAGEEVNLQGANYYVKEFIKETAPQYPRFLVNLELAGQKGNLFYVDRVGIFLKFHETSRELKRRVGDVWRGLTGKGMTQEDRISDDSLQFITAGVPAITIGHDGAPGLGMGDFHSEKDNMDRVDPENLGLMVKMLEGIIDSY